MTSEGARYSEMMTKAVTLLQNEIGPPPQAAVVLGSGLSTAGQSWPKIQSIPYDTIPGFPEPGITGHPGRLWIVRNASSCFVTLAGRCHYYEGFTLPEVVFPVRALAAWGVTDFILTNAAGGIRPTLTPGSLMLISDHINFMGDNPLRALHVSSLGERFPDLTQAYTASLRKLAHECAARLHLKLEDGVYLAVTGPQYETPAEIRMFGRSGADAIGMSTVPEVIALVQMRCRVLAVSVITNLAAGVGPDPLSHLEVLATGTAAAESLGKLILEITESL
ncbi:MAG: purine-nucleoside phosphorylase [Acidobacteria bacterium]|nr:MAG: purine-nucleoside phosphorylase [Acidobacteriota bacterium]